MAGGVEAELKELLMRMRMRAQAEGEVEEEDLFHQAWFA